MPKYTLKTPLVIDVAEIIKFLPECWHRKPYPPYEGKSASEAIFYENLVDDTGKTILHFEDKDDLGFNTISTDLTLQQLANLFTRLPATLANLLKNSLGVEFPEPLISPEDTEAAAIIANQNQVLKTVLAIPTRYTEPTYQISEAVYVQEHGIAFTSSDSNYPVLVSSGAVTCVIVAAYNPTNRFAVLVHADCLIDLTNLVSHIKSIQNTPDEKIILHLAGGNVFAKRFVNNLILALSAIQNSEFATAFLYQDERDIEPKALSIDARTGFSSLVAPKQLIDNSHVSMSTIQGLRRSLATPTQEATSANQTVHNQAQYNMYAKEHSQLSLFKSTKYLAYRDLPEILGKHLLK
jgi:hypothetical protein